MVSQTIWIVDTQNRSNQLIEAIASPQIEVISLQATSTLAPSISSRANGAVIANIHENEDFETLEHLSKISLTFPEIPLVLLLPEPLHASIDWGPRVFNLIKPVSPESILKRLSFLDEHSYPTRGILQRGYLLALLDHCLLQKKHVRILIRYAGQHTCEILIGNGKLLSLYIDNSLKNDKILFPFALDGAEFSMEHLDDAAGAEAPEQRFSIGDDEYRRFRLELHPFLSLMQQFPPMSEVLRIDDARLMRVLNSLPEQVHSVVRHFDGKNDLFQIFLQSELRPLETAQRIGYLYFSDVFQVPAHLAGGSAHLPGGSMFPDATPPAGGAPAAPMRERSSSELAGWLLNPVAAARELEEKIKKNLKSRKPADAQFRPHRKTQPGLGGLLRPVLEEEPEDEASRSSWGGVNVRLLRESQEMLLKMSAPEESTVPGMEAQTIEFEDEAEDENAQASGVIDVSAADEPAVDGTGSPKIILDSAPLVSGEAELPTETDSGPSAGPPVAFHDEPTMPLEQLEDPPAAEVAPAPEQVSQDSLLELLSLRSEDRSHTVPMRTLDPVTPGGHQTREMPAVSLPDGDVTPNPGLKETPVPDFDQEPNSARTPRPEISVDDPTPLPEERAPLLTPAEHGTDEESGRETPVVPETMTIPTKPRSSRSDDAKAELQTFQKTNSEASSKWKYFIVLAIIAGLGFWYVFKSGSDDAMTAAPSNEAAPPATMQPEEAPGPTMTEPAMVEPAMTEPSMVEPAMVEPVPTVDASPVQPDKPAGPDPALVARTQKLYEDYNRKETKALAQEIEKLATENPGFAPAASYLADINYRRNRIQKAREWAEKAVSLDRDQALAWWVIGLVAYEARQKAVYIDAFRNYLRLSPNDQKARDIRQMGIRELMGP